ncbi:MAG: hypothetical protein ABI867_30730 [Kofleriaceae bacterium]
MKLVGAVMVMMMGCVGVEPRVSDAVVELAIEPVHGPRSHADHLASVAGLGDSMCELLPPDGLCAHLCDRDLEALLPDNTCVDLFCELEDGRLVTACVCN